MENEKGPAVKLTPLDNPPAGSVLSGSRPDAAFTALGSDRIRLVTQHGVGCTEYTTQLTSTQTHHYLLRPDSTPGQTHVACRRVSGRGTAPTPWDLADSAEAGNVLRATTRATRTAALWAAAVGRLTRETDGFRKGRRAGTRDTTSGRQEPTGCR